MAVVASAPTALRGSGGQQGGWPARTRPRRVFLGCSCTGCSRCMRDNCTGPRISSFRRAALLARQELRYWRVVSETTCSQRLARRHWRSSLQAGVFQIAIPPREGTGLAWNRFWETFNRNRIWPRVTLESVSGATEILGIPGRTSRRSALAAAHVISNVWDL